MIKIIPFLNRRLTRKNLAKLWNLFPNEEFCMIESTAGKQCFTWAKIIARYYTLRGKDFSIEIDAVNFMEETEQYIKCGVKKFYFLWNGIRDGLFFASSDVIQYALYILERYEDVEITIIYTVPYDLASVQLDIGLFETSIQLLNTILSQKTRLHGTVRYPHPWYGKQRMSWLKEAQKLVSETEFLTIEPKCGCLTITPNTNIYCCPFCERLERKKRFGDADREKFVCGTIERGIFRHINCNACNFIKNAKNFKIKYNKQGVN